MITPALGNYPPPHDSDLIPAAPPLDLSVIKIKDGNFTLLDDGDPTKKVQFQLSSLSAATQRTLSVPDASGTLPLQVAVLNTSVSITTAAATLFTPVSDHAYLVTVYLRTSSAGNAGDVQSVTLGWNDNVAQTRVVSFESNGVIVGTHNMQTLNATSQGSVVIFSSTTTAVTWLTTAVVRTGAPVASLKIRVVDLS